MPLKIKLDGVHCEMDERFFFFFSFGPFLLTDENQNKGRVGDCRSQSPLGPAAGLHSPAAVLSLVFLG